MRNEADYKERFQFLKACLDKEFSQNIQEILSSKIAAAENPEALAKEYGALILKGMSEDEVLKNL